MRPEIPEVPKERFTGIFIRVEILDLEDLTLLDQVLLSWIDALYCEQRGGCFASNVYLAKRLKVKENTVAKSITKLRHLGLIEDISFDGRNRIIRALIDKFVDRHQSKAGLDLNPRQRWTKIQGSVGQKSKRGTPQPYIEIKEERKGEGRKGLVKSKVIPAQPTPKISKETSDNVCTVGNQPLKVKNTSKNVKNPENQKISHGKYVWLYEGRYEALCSEYGKETIDLYIEKIDTKYPNLKKKYDDFEAAIRSWILDDKSKNPQNAKKPQPVSNDIPDDKEGFNRALARDLDKKLKNKIHFFSGATHVEIDNKRFEYKNNKFRDLVNEFLKEREIKVRI